MNPSRATVAGMQAFSNVAELPVVPDVVVVQVGSGQVLRIVEDACAFGVRNFVVPGAGATDSGPLALAIVEGLRRLNAELGVRVVGPNCMGFVDLVSGAAPYVGTVPSHVRRGSVGVIAQSGAVAELFINSGGRVPHSTVISSGAEAVVSTADYLNFFADDPETSSVVAFIEALDDADAFLEAATRLAEYGKPLAVTFVGKTSTSQEGVQAHSGRLAPRSRVTAAALSQAGAFIADDLDELLAFGEVFGSPGWPRGPRTQFVTNSGGEGNLLADLSADAGLVLPRMAPDDVRKLSSEWPLFHVRNPLDPWGVADYPVVYPTAIAVAADQDVDILVVSHDQQQTSGEHEKTLGLDLARYLATETRDGLMRVMLSPTSQDPDPRISAFCRDRGLTQLRGARPALSVLGKLARPPMRQPIAEGRAIVARVNGRPVARLLDPEPLSEDEAMTVVEAFGVRVPRRVLASTPTELATDAATIARPVVVKGAAHGLVHKSELGLVELGIRGHDAITEAACRILSRAHGAGLVVELIAAEMVSGELEVYAGYVKDPLFGHTLLLGLGGVWTEVLDQVDVYVGLLDLEQAEQWVATTQVGSMMAGARGEALDHTGIALALTALSCLAQGNGNVIAVDLNPILVGRSECIAVDAVIQRSTDLPRRRNCS